MSRTLLLLALFGLLPSRVLAQASDSPKWDLAGTIGLIESNPSTSHGLYGDDWYADGRYAVAAGHYWTEHLKTETEFSTSGEGSTYGFVHPSSVESRHRLEQLSARMVWQFGENQWVHPYVSVGLVGDRARTSDRTPAQYQYPSGRTSGPMILIPEAISDPKFEYRAGVTAGAGAKIYMSRKAFFTTGFITTYSKAATTLGLLAGFGFDF